MSQSIVKLPVNTRNNEYTEAVQWGVEDTRTGRVIRTAAKRTTARNFARRSKFYRVVSRTLFVDGWFA